MSLTKDDALRLHREKMELFEKNIILRDQTIEECARVAEQCGDPDAVSVSVLAVRIAAAIRALKDKPQANPKGFFEYYSWTPYD